MRARLFRTKEDGGVNRRGMSADDDNGFRSK